MHNTIEERFACTSLSASERPKRRYHYVVTGRGHFPTDMLRYDRAWPADQESASLVDLYHYSNNIEERRALRSIRLNSYTEPTIDRWSSFGWSVGNRAVQP